MKHIFVPYPVLFSLTISFLIVCAGCEDASKRPEPMVTEVQECKVGDGCVFRPTFGSALVFTNLRASQRFRLSKLEGPDDSYAMWRDWEAKGDWTVLQKGTQIRVLRDVEGGVEAMVEIDNYRPAPNGGIGMVGTKIAGHKVWLESKLAPLNRWQRAR